MSALQRHQVLVQPYHLLRLARVVLEAALKPGPLAKVVRNVEAAVVVRPVLKVDEGDVGLGMGLVDDVGGE